MDVDEFESWLRPMGHGVTKSPDNSPQLIQAWGIVAYRPFIGPWLAEALAFEARLSATGIQVIWRRRAWNTEHFPHATRGYFPFWEKIKVAG